MYALSLFFCSNHFAFSVHLRTFIPIKFVQSYLFWEEGWLKRVDNQYFNIPGNSKTFRDGMLCSLNGFNSNPLRRKMKIGHSILK